MRELIKIDEKTNNLLRLVKVRYNLKNRSEAINFIAKRYEKKYLR